MINWNEVSKEDFEKIVKIVLRAKKLAYLPDSFQLEMDIQAVHLITPLDLDDLLNASVQDFSHDLAGIDQHIDRETGELKNCFVPRYTKRDQKLEKMKRIISQDLEFGASEEEINIIAEIAVKEECGSWHAIAIHHGKLNSCHCAKCEESATIHTNYKRN